MCNAGLYPTPETAQQGDLCRLEAASSVLILEFGTHAWPLPQRSSPKTRPRVSSPPPSGLPNLPRSCLSPWLSCPGILMVCEAKWAPRGSLHQSPHAARGLFLNTKLTCHFPAKSSQWLVFTHRKKFKIPSHGRPGPCLCLLTIPSLPPSYTDVSHSVLPAWPQKHHAFVHMAAGLEPPPGMVSPLLTTPFPWLG